MKLRRAGPVLSSPIAIWEATRALPQLRAMPWQETNGARLLYKGSDFAETDLA